MQTESVALSFLSIITLTSFFVILVIQKFFSKIENEVLLDKDFDKPQAFHKEAVARSGGLASIISLIIFFVIYYFLFQKVLIDYLIISSALFLIGFLDDIKFRINPNSRLILMIIILSLSIIYFPINIDKTHLGFLDIWLENKIFHSMFILLCFLFIINGANLVDGFNGLLTIHLIVINCILLFININSGETDFAMLLTGQIIILACFLLFNFPKAKMFLGDGGSYLFGSLVALNIIKTNNLNPEISSFFFCILLFYLFFEVFFSFFRKLYLKKSPLKPDNNHLHMLLYNYLEKTKKFADCNYLNSIFINVIYFSLILPSLYFKGSGLICRYWFFFLLILYISFYFRLYSFTKK